MTRRDFIVGGSVAAVASMAASPVRSLLGVRMLAESNEPKLPYNAEVEYLESTGTQWIDTGISMDIYPSIGFRIGLNPLVSVNKNPATDGFCGFSNYGSRWFGVNFMSLNSRGLQIGLGNTAYNSSNMAIKDYEVLVSSELGVLLDGMDTGYTYSHGIGGRKGTTFYVFAICARDSSNINHISPRQCRIYSLTIYNGEDVLQDFIPVRFMNEQGISEGAMYDRISGELFRNQGTGAFIIGPDIS